MPILAYGWPLWSPLTAAIWRKILRKMESVVCLPLRCCLDLGLPVSAERLALLVDFGLVRPQLWHGCSALVFAHRVDTQLVASLPNHPAHAVFLEQSRTALPPKCPKYRIPLAKAR